jgi:hypothetical protein
MMILFPDGLEKAMLKYIQPVTVYCILTMQFDVLKCLFDQSQHNGNDIVEQLKV